MIDVLGFRLKRMVAPTELNAGVIAPLTRDEAIRFVAKVAPELQWRRGLTTEFAYHHGKDGSIIEFKLHEDGTVAFDVNGFFGDALAILCRFHDLPDWLLIDTSDCLNAWHPPSPR